MARWYLGSMNDGRFIIDTPPRPSTDDVWMDRPDGPNMVLNVTDLPQEKAQAIVDAHNAEQEQEVTAYHHIRTTITDQNGLRDKIVHVSAGAPDWEPTVEEMSQLSDLFLEGFLSAPSVVVTRKGVIATVLDRDGFREELPTADVLQLVREPTNG